MTTRSTPVSDPTRMECPDNRQPPIHEPPIPGHGLSPPGPLRRARPPRWMPDPPTSLPTSWLLPDKHLYNRSVNVYDIWHLPGSSEPGWPRLVTQVATTPESTIGYVRFRRFIRSHDDAMGSWCVLQQGVWRCARRRRAPTSRCTGSQRRVGCRARDSRVHCGRN